MAETEYNFQDGSEDGWQIVLNKKCWGDEGEVICKHCHSMESHPGAAKDVDGNPMIWHTYILPKAIGVYITDGDYYAVLCLDCILEQTGRLSLSK